MSRYKGLAIFILFTVFFILPMPSSNTFKLPTKINDALNCVSVKVVHHLAAGNFIPAKELEVDGPSIKIYKNRRILNFEYDPTYYQAIVVSLATIILLLFTDKPIKVHYLLLSIVCGFGCFMLMVFVRNLAFLNLLYYTDFSISRLADNIIRFVMLLLLYSYSACFYTYFCNRQKKQA